MYETHMGDSQGKILTKILSVISCNLGTSVGDIHNVKTKLQYLRILFPHNENLYWLLSHKTPSPPWLNLLAMSLYISKSFQCMEIEFLGIANLWQHYGYHQHLFPSYKWWHLWCHDVINDYLVWRQLSHFAGRSRNVCKFADMCYLCKKMYLY